MEQVNQFLSQYKIPLGLSFVGLVLILGGLFSSGTGHKTIAATAFPAKSIVKPADLAQIKVDISGAVNNPGVYNLQSGDRIEDVIKVAGGFGPKVNQEYISKSLNLSQKISDGQKIYVPYQGETGVILGASTTASGASTTGKVGINSGSTQELNSLPGVGDVTSQKIIGARPYSVIDDLLNKKIVSRAVFTKIKDLIDLN